MVDGGHRTAAAQMAGDELEVAGALAQELRGTLHEIAVRSAMRTVLPDAKLLVELVWNRVHVRARGHGLVKRRIEHADMGNVGHDFTAGANALDGRRVMQRRELRAELDIGNDLVIREDGLAELLPTMHDTMPDCANLVQALDAGVRILDEHIKDHLDGNEMVFHRLLEDALVVLVPVLDKGVGLPDLLAQATRHELFGLRIDDLVLERRATRIDYQNVHRYPLLPSPQNT